MSDAVDMTGRPTTPNASAGRGIRLLRAAVLFVAGLGIAFTATMHARLSFDIGVTTAVLGVLGIVHLAAWFSSRASAIPLLLGVVAIVAAILVPFTSSAVGFAVVVAAWSLASALLEFVGAAAVQRSDATLLGALGVLLSILVLLVREDPVAVLGFFGGYAVIAGVFLGISAFDANAPAAETDPEAP